MDCVLLLLSLWALVGSVSLQTVAGSCPERLLGQERRRTCPKPCKLDRDCGSKRQCLCDGQCGLSCVAPGRTCPWPLPVAENTEVRLLSPTHSFSALLEVRCKPGFTLSGGLDALIRRCQGDRQWSGDEPTCTEELIEKAEITEARAAHCLRNCLSGADLVGSSENFCQENQTWQYPHPICKKVYCQPPRDVEFGYVVAVQKTEYEVGFEVHFLCKKNFLLDGPQRVTCLPNGSWSEAPPHCRSKACATVSLRATFNIHVFTRTLQKPDAHT
ncbi:hypothetical protein WMY93_025932 [Mugilogobius chulae]|uniref:Beta-2-glycoprotein I n=1 Tax=Mugilogobius chulae TaxID=88201 RepID=A0AAW0N0T0_9GOBI